MGTAANGYCHATAELAASHVCGTVYPLASAGVAGDGSAVSVAVQCSGAAGTTLTLHRYRDGVDLGPHTVEFAGAPCDELEWLTHYPFSLSATDGALLGGAIASVWFAGAAWRWVARVLHVDGGHRSDDE